MINKYTSEGLLAVAVCPKQQLDNVGLVLSQSEDQIHYIHLLQQQFPYPQRSPMVDLVSENTNGFGPICSAYGSREKQPRKPAQLSVSAL